MSERLFDVPAPQFYRPDNEPSATQRRTLRNRRLIERGIHPATRVKLRAEGGTCGDCAHSDGQVHHDRTYWKCDLIPVTFGPGTDIRKSWPACERWEIASV